MTSGGGRRRARGQRLLYFFRTPPGIRVGRAPIDEDAIRLLEEHNPGVQFDWTRILKQSPETGPHPTSQEQGRRENRRERSPVTSSQSPAASSQSAVTSSPLPVSGSELPVSSSRSPDDGVSETEGTSDEGVEIAESSDSLEPIDAAQAVEPEAVEPVDPLEPVPLIIDNGELVARHPQLATDVDVAPRYARLGAEGLARLRARYAEVMARIAEKSVEEPVKEELRTKAQRLNPDAWVTEEEVAAALEQYETVFEAIRPLVGRPPRHRRPRRRRG